MSKTTVVLVHMKDVKRVCYNPAYIELSSGMLFHLKEGAWPFLVERGSKLTITLTKRGVYTVKVSK